MRFHENLIAAGRRPEKRVLLIEERAATQGEARALQIGVGALVCAYHGVSLADGQALALFESLFPLERVLGVTDALSQTSSVSSALARAGIADFTRSSTRITATRASATQALH